MFNQQINRFKAPQLEITRSASLRNANGIKLELQAIVDSIDSVFSKGQTVITDCDECLVTEDLGVLHFKKVFQNPFNFQIGTVEEFEEILIPEHLQNGLQSLMTLNPKLADKYFMLKLKVVESYFDVQNGYLLPEIFIHNMVEFDSLTFKVESFLRDNTLAPSHPTIKNYLLIRCRLYHAMNLDRLNESFQGLVRYNTSSNTEEQFSSPKTIIYDTLSQTCGKPIICSTNLYGIVASNFDNSFTDEIHGTQYGACSLTNTFIGKLNSEPIFKDEKTNTVLRRMGLEESFTQASETIGFMAGDSASNDLPAMIAALSGEKGYVMVRIKGNEDEYENNVSTWCQNFKQNGIDDITIQSRVFFVDER